MTYPATLAEALAQSDVLFDRDQLNQAICRIAADIDAALEGERALYLTVMHGALIFAGELALEIKTDIEFDYVHATRYRGATTGSELHWLREPQCDMKGRTVLLVDDILDEGHTLKAIRETLCSLGIIFLDAEGSLGPGLRLDCEKSFTTFFPPGMELETLFTAEK